jgi:hypothetical protein
VRFQTHLSRRLTIFFLSLSPDELKLKIMGYATFFEDPISHANIHSAYSTCLQPYLNAANVIAKEAFYTNNTFEINMEMKLRYLIPFIMRYFVRHLRVVTSADDYGIQRLIWFDANILHQFENRRSLHITVAWQIFGLLGNGRRSTLASLRKSRIHFNVGKGAFCVEIFVGDTKLDETFDLNLKEVRARKEATTILQNNLTFELCTE